MSNLKKAAIVLSIPLVFIAGIPSGYDIANASNVDSACRSATAVFARGSGQNVNQKDSEAARFRDQLKMRIGDSSLNFYELGTET